MGGFDHRTVACHRSTESMVTRLTAIDWSFVGSIVDISGHQKGRMSFTAALLQLVVFLFIRESCKLKFAHCLLHVWSILHVLVVDNGFNYVNYIKS